MDFVKLGMVILEVDFSSDHVCLGVVGLITNVVVLVTNDASEHNSLVGPKRVIHCVIDSET